MGGSGIKLGNMELTLDSDPSDTMGALMNNDSFCSRTRVSLRRIRWGEKGKLCLHTMENTRGEFNYTQTRFYTTKNL